MGHGQASQAGIDLWHAELLRMALAVEADEPANPTNIRRFGTQRIMRVAQRVAHLIERWYRICTT